MNRIDEMWKALKAECCKLPPEEAQMIVFLTEKRFRAAMEPLFSALTAREAEDGRLPTSKPTEPGYYWLLDHSWRAEQPWVIVEVAKDIAYDGLVYYYTSCEYPFSLNSVADDAWGGRITQLPTPDPPPPF